MNSSLFKKQFFFYTSTLIIIFTLLGIGIIHAFTSYFMEEKKQSLILQGEKIVSAFQGLYNDTGIYNLGRTRNEIAILATYLDSSFVFIDSDYRITIISGRMDTDWLGKEMNTEFVERTLKGNISFETSTFYNVFSENTLILGYPVKFDSEIIGAVFMCSPTTGIERTLADAYKTIVIFICLAILLGFTIITIFSGSITKPLSKMTEAAKIIASGNFSYRINVKSNDEIGELAETFNIMAESLERQETVRTQFISNISHDLRSPLTSIKGFLTAILDGTIPVENHPKYIKIIYDEAERLTKLANSILEANDESNDGIELNQTDFDLNLLVKKIAISFSGTTSRKHIYLKLVFDDNEALVYADKEKVERILYNLVDNAIKFTPAEGSIKIIVIDAYDKIKITVSDTGQGISETDKKRIFERFFKADSSRGIDKMGMGLGLAIVKKFVKAHGSRVEVESKLGEGTSFSFMLNKSTNSKLHQKQ